MSSPCVYGSGGTLSAEGTAKECWHLPTYYLVFRIMRELKTHPDIQLLQC
jgi:hypothetical protein